MSNDIAPYDDPISWAAAPNTLVELHSEADVRSGVGLEVPGFKTFVPPAPYEIPDELKVAIAHYWEDPVANGHMMTTPNGAPRPRHRFALGEVAVSGLDRDGAGLLAELLRGGPVRFETLVTSLEFPQLVLLKRLLRAGVVGPESVSKAA